MVKNILLAVLVSLGLSAEWGTSFSVRTPNDATKDSETIFLTKEKGLTNKSLSAKLLL